MFKVTKALIIFFILAGTLLLPTFSQAETVSYPTAVKDSDYDGLTDQGEKQIYKTDPQNPDSDGDSYLDGAEILAGTNPLSVNSLAVSASNSGSSNFWPWYFTRASGLSAYFFLFLLVLTGIGIKTSQSFKFLSPTFAWLNHKYIGIALTFSVAVHLISLLVDNYLKFTIIDILIPYASSFKPIFLSLGIVGFYILLAVIMSSIFTINKFPKAWRLLHYLPYFLFVILFIHGYFIGTDTTAPLIKGMYLITASLVAILSTYRLYFFYKQL